MLKTDSLFKTLCLAAAALTALLTLGFFVQLQADALAVCCLLEQPCGSECPFLEGLFSQFRLTVQHSQHTAQLLQRQQIHRRGEKRFCGGHRCSLPAAYLK